MSVADPRRSRARACRPSGRRDLGPDKAARGEDLEDVSRVVLRGAANGLEDDLGVLGGLVRIVDPGKALDLPAPRHGIHSLGVAGLTDLDRRIHEDLDEVVRPDHVPDVVARGAVRTDGGAQDDTAVAHDLRGNEADAPDVGVAVLLT